MLVHSPFIAAFTPGTRFAQQRGGPVEVSVRVLGDLKVPTGRIAVSDPFTTSFDEAAVPLARTSPTGTFPVEVSLAHFENGDQRVASARVRFGAGPAATWEPALFDGQAPPPGDQYSGYGVDAGMGCFYDAAARAAVDEATTDAWLTAAQKSSVNTWTSHVAEVGPANVVMFSSGWGDGFYGSWWGIDANGRVAELVTDFDVLTEAATASFELPLPLTRGAIAHPLLAANEVTLKVPLLSRTTIIAGGKGMARLAFSDGTAIQLEHPGRKGRWHWKVAPRGAKLVVSVVVGTKALDVLR